MNFVKKIFEDKIDENVHKQFKRFSKGTFERRAVVEINVTGKNIKIKTSFEYANDLVRLLVGSINGKAKILGGIITTKDIKGTVSFDIAHVKQFAGVKTYELDTEISKDELIKLIDEFPDAMFCLTFSTDYGNIKTKVKTPKSAKPGKGDEDDVKADYCVLTINDNLLLKEFAFDVNETFKKFKAVHDFIINEIIVPKEYENDFAMARIHAKRKGKIIRHVDVDGKQFIKEHEFNA